MNVRPVMDTDIPTVTVLLGHLGYDMSQAEAARRLALVRSNGDHNVWVSEAVSTDRRNTLS